MEEASHDLVPSFEEEFGGTDNNPRKHEVGEPREQYIPPDTDCVTLFSKVERPYLLPGVRVFSARLLHFRFDGHKGEYP